MSLYDIYLSIDWQCLIGFLCLEFIAFWVGIVDGANNVLPDPDARCIAHGEPRHYAQTIEWQCGTGRVRHDFVNTLGEQHDQV